MDKFNCNYQLLVQTKSGGTLSFKRPFTVEFDIHRNTLSSANVGSFRIYNLAPNTRAQIRHDQFDFFDNRLVQFYAGYGSNLSLAFTGYISQAWSVREGVNFITQIESYDGGLAFNTATTNTPFIKGTSQSAIFNQLAQSLPGVKMGAISNQFGGDVLPRGNSYSGNTCDILAELSGGAFFIDNGNANLILDNEFINFGKIPLINAQSGLLNTPVRENTYINVDMIFEPTIHAGSLVQLQSNAIDGGFNGTHKVVELKHHGIISEAVCGERITSIGLLPGTFDPVNPLSGF